MSCGLNVSLDGRQAAWKGFCRLFTPCTTVSATVGNFPNATGVQSALGQSYSSESDACDVVVARLCFFVFFQGVPPFSSYSSCSLGCKKNMTRRMEHPEKLQRSRAAPRLRRKRPTRTNRVAQVLIEQPAALGQLQPAAVAVVGPGVKRQKKSNHAACRPSEDIVNSTQSMWSLSVCLVHPFNSQRLVCQYCN